MKNTIRLNEREMTRLIKRIVKENEESMGDERMSGDINQVMDFGYEMLNAEKEYVNDSFLKLEHVMNLVAGGGGWQTPLATKGKRGYTLRNPRRYTMYDAEYVYKLNLRCKEFKVYGGEIAEMIGRHLINEIPFLFKYLNEMYNQKETHKEAEKFINRIYRSPMFHNNLYIEKRKRQLTLI